MNRIARYAAGVVPLVTMAAVAQPPEVVQPPPPLTLQIEPVRPSTEPARIPTEPVKPSTENVFIPTEPVLPVARPAAPPPERDGRGSR